MFLKASDDDSARLKMLTINSANMRVIRFAMSISPSKSIPLKKIAGFLTLSDGIHTVERPYKNGAAYFQMF